MSHSLQLRPHSYLIHASCMSRLFLWWWTNNTLWAMLQSITSAARNATWKVQLRCGHLTGRVQFTQSCALWWFTSGMQFVAPSHVVRPHRACICESHLLLRVKAHVCQNAYASMQISRRHVWKLENWPTPTNCIPWESTPCAELWTAMFQLTLQHSGVIRFTMWLPTFCAVRQTQSA